MDSWRVLSLQQPDSPTPDQLEQMHQRYLSADGDGSFEGDIAKVGLKSCIISYLLKFGQAQFDEVLDWVVARRCQWSSRHDWDFRRAWDDIIRLLRDGVDPDFGPLAA